MFSCSNNQTGSCFNGGQCVSNSCICSTACYSGDNCTIYYNVVDLPFATAMSKDTLAARIIYIFLITSLVVIGLMNNIAGLLTFTRENIRLTACGIYLIIFAICTIIRMIFLQTIVLDITEYDIPSYRFWSCYTNPYISLVLGFANIWLSVGIAIERVLIECLDMKFYGTRRHAVLISIGCLIYSAISNLPAIFAREYLPDPSGKLICTYDYLSHPSWKRADTVFAYIDLIVPCIAHVICSVCILTTIARRKIFLYRNQQPKQRLYRVWFRQFYIHRDFLIPPLCIVLCLLPNSIHGHLIAECIPYSSVTHFRLHILFIFLLHIPSIFIYFVYIYPNESYRKELRQTLFYKLIYCHFCRRHQIRLQQQQSQLTLKSTLSQSIDNTNL